MSESHAAAQETAAAGRRLVENELLSRGFTCEEQRDGNRIILIASKDQTTIRILTRTRKSGTWHATSTAGDPSLVRHDMFWVFVDLTNEPAAFFVVPDEWMRKDIERVHAAYLESHGGERPETPGSDHHGINGN